ncbi:unnamed protein product [Owenia fusiformis]|uniref:Peptidase metallopeptidase domain-containing protein n=1 Tax=Owenia fusiformis TaxID=6347 RepID=A0A8S4Q6T3_OWEFU|nr:unnamed protein product [Owenia fusiformis]
MDLKSLVVLVCIYAVIVLTNSKKIKGKTKKNKSLPPGQSKKLGDNPEEFLESFGYLAKPKPGQQNSDAARRAAIRKFQRFNHIPITGSLDEKTKWKMKQPRCGLPDVINPTGSSIKADPNAPSNFYSLGHVWKNRDLTWKISNFSPDLPRRVQIDALTRGLNYWSEVTNLNFRQTSGDSDIDIRFGRYEHGDGYSFDGKGGTLAHAFFPENGRTHFDEDEDWTEDSHDGTNLRIVATHEFGHALGLSHSEVRGAVMAPYYQGYSENFRLEYDDIIGIQTLYGGKARPRPTDPPRRTTIQAPTKKPSTKPDTCTTKIDAILQAHNGKTYVFKYKWMWELTDNGVVKGFPRLARKFFTKPPYNPGAVVYSRRTRKTYFFKDNRVWRYNGFNLETGFPKRIKDKAYPRGPQAALCDASGRILLFKNYRIYQYNEYSINVDAIAPRLITDQFPGLPNEFANVEAALRYKDGYLYFFKGANYRKYDERTQRVLPGYPKAKAPSWMGCGRRTPK